MISDEYEDDYEDVVETPKDAPEPKPKSKPLVTLKIISGVQLSKPKFQLRSDSHEKQQQADKPDLENKSDGYSDDEQEIAEFKKTAVEYH